MSSRNPFAAVRPTPAEVARAMPGDGVLAAPDVVMDRAFDLPAAPADVWPWLAQMGRRRGGWYLPRGFERLLPRTGRALRHIDPSMTQISVGDVIPDWPGRDDTFELIEVEQPRHLVHHSMRGRMEVTWAIELRDTGSRHAPGTRVQLRLRLGPVRRRQLVETAGDLVDLLTIAGLAAGLSERV